MADLRFNPSLNFDDDEENFDLLGEPALPLGGDAEFSSGSTAEARAANEAFSEVMGTLDGVVDNLDTKDVFDIVEEMPIPEPEDPAINVLGSPNSPTFDPQIDPIERAPGSDLMDIIDFEAQVDDVEIPQLDLPTSNEDAQITEQVRFEMARDAVEAVSKISIEDAGAGLNQDPEIDLSVFDKVGGSLSDDKQLAIVQSTLEMQSERVDTLEAQLNEESTTRNVAALVRNNQMAEYGGLSTRRSPLREGSGVG